MQMIYYLMMIAGGAAMSFGFRLTASRESRTGWAGIVLLYAGLVAAFLGVLLAFAPRFFSES